MILLNCKNIYNNNYIYFIYCSPPKKMGNSTSKKGSPIKMGKSTSKKDSSVQMGNSFLKKGSPIKMGNLSSKKGYPVKMSDSSLKTNYCTFATSNNYYTTPITKYCYFSPENNSLQEWTYGTNTLQRMSPTTDFADFSRNTILGSMIESRKKVLLHP